MPKKKQDDAEAPLQAGPQSTESTELSAAALAKRHLEEALKRKREAQAGQTGHATVDKGNVPHHPVGPAKGRNFRHQGR